MRRLCLSAQHTSQPPHPALRGHPACLPAPSAPCRYQRHREALLAWLLVAHAVLLRSTSLPTLLRLLPDASLHRLPWLLRATGAEALAIFPIGFKASTPPPACLAAACLPCMPAQVLALLPGSAMWRLALPEQTGWPPAPGDAPCLHHCHRLPAP